MSQYKEGQVMGNKYLLETPLGSGSFGSVFRAKNIRTGEYVAIKTEQRATSGLLANEARVYRYLSSMQYIPKMRWFSTNAALSFLVLDLLGDDTLASVSLNAEESVVCGIKMITIIQELHTRKMLHRDIKPANFVFADDDTDNIYLIDFGFCRSYENPDGTHIEERFGKGVLGTPEFVSDHVRKGCEPSRRDDVWSIAKTIEFACDGLIDLQQMKEYCHLLPFNETPNYELLKEMLLNSFNVVIV